MISMLFGVIAAALGVWGTFVWRNEFLAMAKGLLPISLFFSGVVAAIVGLSGLLSKLSPKPKDHGKD